MSEAETLVGTGQKCPSPTADFDIPIPSATTDLPAPVMADQKEKRVGARFVYRRISSEEFRKELDRQRLSPKAFARIFGVQPRRATKWYHGAAQADEIPPWVPIALTLLSMPKAHGTARMAAAAMIETDNMKPERGRFPYLKDRELPADLEEGDDG